MPAGQRLALILLAVAGALACLVPAAADAPARVVVEPDAGRQPIVDVIGSARSSIDLAIYELSDRRIVAALGDAARRGVRVRILAEPDPGGHPANAHALEELRQKGAVAEDGSPSFLFTHEKTLVVDGASVLIMSLNLTAESFDGSRDVAVLDTDPDDVAEVEAVFEADWNRQPATVAQPSLVWSPDNARARILALLQSATAEIDIYAEELVDLQILATLETEAVAGVHVRLLMTDTGSGDSSRASRAALAAAGGEVRLLRKPYVHAKVIVVDGALAFAGSENLSAASLDRNRELGILTADTGTIAALSGMFEDDWARAVPAPN